MGKGLPYTLNAWTGDIEPIGLYRADSQRATLTVELGPNDIQVVAIGKGIAPLNKSDIHFIASDLNDVKAAGGRLVLRSTKTGTFQATLSNKRGYEFQVGHIDAPIVSATWSLDVESWTPDASGMPGLDHTAKTALPSVAIQTDSSGSLPNWSDLGMSGRYRRIGVGGPIRRD